MGDVEARVDGLAAVTKVRDAMDAAGLGRTSRMNGGELTGWTRSLGSTGFSVRQKEDGTVSWHVVVSGKPHLRYRDYEWEGDSLHEPTDPDVLCPRIRRVFEGLGLAVASVRYAGHQTMWDDDVEYDVETARPGWLEDVPPPPARTYRPFMTPRW